MNPSVGVGGPNATKPKTNYADAEWQTLLFGVFWVFEAVAGADDNIDRKEQDALLHAIAAFNPTALTHAIQSEVHANFDSVKAAYEADPRDIATGLADVETLLARYPNEEQAAETRRALVHLATLVAEASGGFLGFGSKVSKAEASAIANIRSILKLPT